MHIKSNGTEIIMKKFENFSKGMGIGGWLTNYKRFNVLPQEWRLPITVGDMEHFETYITEEDVINIKNMGFDHIRLGFDQIVVEESPYVYRERIFELLISFADSCKKHGLRLVLNLHKAIGNYCDIAEAFTLFDSRELQDRFIALWVEIERRFANYPDVMFELLNEVRDIEPMLWNNLAEETLGAIRKQNPERPVIVGSTCWNNCNALKALKLYDDENVIYTFHIYDPFEFTHQRGVLQGRTLYYNRKMQYPSDDIERYRDYHRLINNNPELVMYKEYERIDRKLLEDILAPAIEFVKQHPDKILWNGEFGTIRHADITSRENYMRDVISICRENDIPYCVWNYLSTPNDGNRFSLVDDDTRKILSERLGKILIGEE